MTIEQANVIDHIGIQSQTGAVSLVVSDHLEWEHEAAHLGMLQDKLNTYLRFIESGEIHEAYPQALGRKIEIVVFGKYELTPAAKEYFLQAAQTIEQAGFSLRHRLVE